MGGAFISSWLRMMVSAATSAAPIQRTGWTPANVKDAGGINRNIRNTVAAAKRAALKAKRRKAHKRRCR